MIRLPLDKYSYKGHAESPDICVDIDPEGGGLVRLTVEFEPGEFAPNVKERESKDNRLVVGEIERLRMELEATHNRAKAFEQALEQVRQEREVWRYLLPQEARELAAMLRHYAEEAER